MEFLDLITENGLPGLVTGLFVLIAVYVLNYSGLVVTSNWKRVSNIVLSIALAGVNLPHPIPDDVMVALIAAVSSGLTHELLKFLEQRRLTKK